MLYLTTHSTHFYLTNTQPPHGLHFSISSKSYFICTIHREDTTYQGLWYTSRGTLVGKKNRSMGPPWGIDPTTHRTMSGRSTTELHLALIKCCGIINKKLWLLIKIDAYGILWENVEFEKCTTIAAFLRELGSLPLRVTR